MEVGVIASLVRATDAEVTVGLDWFAELDSGKRVDTRALGGGPSIQVTQARRGLCAIHRRHRGDGPAEAHRFGRSDIEDAAREIGGLPSWRKARQNWVSTWAFIAHAGSGSTGISAGVAGRTWSGARAEWRHRPQERSRRAAAENLKSSQLSNPRPSARQAVRGTPILSADAGLWSEQMPSDCIRLPCSSKKRSCSARHVPRTQAGAGSSSSLAGRTRRDGLRPQAPSADSRRPRTRA